MKNRMILLCIVFIVFSIYVVAFFNTNSIINEVKDIMCGNVDESVTADTPLSRYNNSDILKNAQVNVKITRLFVAHNFFDGYMWVIYTSETIKNDKDLKPGSWNVVSCWKIHRENGKWKIVDIKEKS